MTVSSAAASGAQQTVSEKYERLDGVKVPECLQHRVGPADNMLPLHQKRSGWHTGCIVIMRAGVAGV